MGQGLNSGLQLLTLDSMDTKLLRATNSIRFCVRSASESPTEEPITNCLESCELGCACMTPGGALHLIPRVPPRAGQHSGSGWEHWPGSPET